MYSYSYSIENVLCIQNLKDNHTYSTYTYTGIHSYIYKLYTYDMIYIPDLAYSLKREETYHILSHDNKYNLEQYMFDL